MAGKGLINVKVFVKILFNEIDRKFLQFLNLPMLEPKTIAKPFSNLLTLIFWEKSEKAVWISRF